MSEGHFKGRDIVSIDHFTTDEIVWFLDQTQKFKDAKKNNEFGYSKLLKDRVMGYAFFEASTRTRLSFMRAARKQGMDRIGFGKAEGTSLEKDESLHHSIEMLAQYEADVLVIRNKSEGAAQFAADKLDIPVINAGDGRHEHPTQTILDLYSIRETQGRLENLNIAMIGDLKNGRTVHSLIKALRRFPGNKFFLVSPPQLAMPAEYVHSEGHPGSLEDIAICYTPEEALEQADIGYVTRVQKERIADDKERRAVLGAIQVKQSSLRNVRPNLKLLHPLPIDAENPEIEKTLYRTHPQHIYFFKQAGNGLYSREVELCAVVGAIGEDFEGEGYRHPERSDKNVMIPLPIREKIGDEKERKFVYSIDNGVVIDHVPPGQVIRIYRELKLENAGGEVIFADNLRTGRQGMERKGLIKLVNHQLSPEEFKTLAILCPEATVSIINGGKVAEKYNVQLPDKVDGLLECQNDSCISRNPREDAPAVFYTASRNPAILSCHYCDTRHSLERGNIKIILK